MSDVTVVTMISAALVLFPNLIVTLFRQCEKEAARRTQVEFARRDEARRQAKLWFEARTAELRQQRTAEIAAVAQMPAAPHNPGRRRMLPLN